ncbi:MAG: hypothetical protein J0L97_00620 [Alphaproteobacteria bacterium]|nr:hypothetical protein [Alphaproteobacteria bacterium]
MLEPSAFWEYVAAAYGVALLLLVILFLDAFLKWRHAEHEQRLFSRNRHET